MTYIAKQSYVKVQREVDGLEQRTTVEERTLTVYRHKVVSHAYVFPIEEVYDMSYRSMGGEEGILYLHTNKGVYPYTVKEHPGAFIEAFQQLKR